MLACILGALLLTGCGMPSDNAKNQSQAATNSAPVASPGPGEKVCFACDGTGMVKCPAPGCVNGQADCPGSCLKLSRGTWIHMNVPGHGPNELWQKYPDLDGRGGYYAFSQNHLGETIVYQNGRAVSTGRCKICGGTGKVRCEVCKGTGKVVCPICDGKKFIPVAWTPTDNPYFNSQPDVIRLTDGQVILGRVAGVDGDDKIIVTRDKKVLHVKASDILPKSGTNSPALQTSPSI
ncbi:MAG: hypothetical protein ABSC01_12350 [Verrucomicrobiota bacterium]